MRVAITGGSGFIGSALTADYLAEDHEVMVLSRGHAPIPVRARRVTWDGRSSGQWWSQVDGADVLFNLAGANIGAGRWTRSRKRVIRESRVEAGAAVVEGLRRMRRPPAVLVQASGVGYYGERADDVLSEDEPAGDDFLGDVAREWEGSSAAVEELGVRRALARTGLVLAAAEGSLPRIARPVRWFVGGRLSSGRQWMSWIHLEDQVRALRFLAAEPAARGPFNLTAPGPVRQRDFVRSLARRLRRPAIAAAPAFALRAVLGEMSDLLLRSQRAVPARLARLGFAFRFPALDEALADLYP